MKEKTKKELELLVMTGPSPYGNMTMTDVIDAFTYVLFLEDNNLNWHKFEKILENFVIKNIFKRDENEYKIAHEMFAGCFMGGSPDTASRWETYFLSRPIRLDLNLSHEKSIFKS